MPEGPGGRRRLTHPFAVGFLCALGVVVAGRACIEETAIVDRLVQPLARQDTQGAADVIVVLGAGVTQLCTPNLSGIQRVMLGARLYHEGRAPLVLMTGGPSAGNGCAVADAMHNLARRLGVPAAHLRVERSSRSTWQNALRSDAVLRTLGATRILLVTDRPHLSRAEATFRRFGYHIERAGVPVPLGHSSNTDLLVSGAREYGAWVYYRMRGFISDRPAERALVAPLDAVDAAAANGTERVVMSEQGAGPLVILGASYAQGWNPERLAGVPVVNAGRDGQQSWELLQRFDADVASRSPRAVIIWGFINDIFRASRPDLEKALDRARESYVAMVKRSRELGIEPIVATEVAIRHKAEWTDEAATFVGRLLGRTGYPDYVNRHVLDTNEWLREFARREGILLLDFEPVLSDGSGRRRRSYAKADGSHITPLAYDALTRYANPLLESHFGSHR